jgi:hypothetical protein
MKAVSAVRIVLLKEVLATCMHAPQMLITYRLAGHVLSADSKRGVAGMLAG